MVRKDNHNFRGAIQCGALCWRENGPDVEILLVTSRDTGRWIIPKGWPMVNKTFAEAAAQEAWEEAGIKGVIHPIPLGSYNYIKPELGMELEVVVFSLNVTKTAEKFPERKQRARTWLSLEKAADLVAEAELAALIAEFV